MNLADPVLQGNRLALARLLTHVENNTEEGRIALAQLFPFTGQSHLIGVTGAPGTGKSTLVNHIARHYRILGMEGNSVEQRNLRVAIVAVDPTSPFSGGAILGDRVRMRDLAGDPNVFIRSMATRGSLGGLAHTTGGIVQVLDAAGFNIILIETVGAGQAEVDIARLAHTTLVIEVPGLGDEIQAIKAGILEIADILVINKADRPGIEATERALKSMLQLAHPIPHIFKQHGLLDNLLDQGNHEPEHQVWLPPIKKTVASEGSGIDELVTAIDVHRKYLLETGEWQRRERARLRAEVESILQERLLERWHQAVSDHHYSNILDEVVKRTISPWQAVNHLIDDHLQD